MMHHSSNYLVNVKTANPAGSVAPDLDLRQELMSATIYFVLSNDAATSHIFIVTLNVRRDAV